MTEWEKCQGCDGDLQHHHCPECGRPLYGSEAMQKPYENGVCFVCAVKASFAEVGESYFET